MSKTKKWQIFLDAGTTGKYFVSGSSIDIGVQFGFGKGIYLEVLWDHYFKPNIASLDKTRR